MHKKILGLCCMLFVVFVACSNFGDVGVVADVVFEEMDSDYDYVDDLDELREKTFIDDAFIEYPTTIEQSQECVIEELGEIIVASGTFWEEWWGDHIIGRFSWEHIAHYAQIPEHFPSAVYWPLLPSSGFESLDDVRNYLLQFYTESWVDAALMRDGAPFVEYDNVLYIGLARAGLARPGWWTASHVLVEQRGDIVVIDTTLYHGSWHRLHSGGDAYPFEVTHRFVFVDGRIDFGPGGWDVLMYRELYPVVDQPQEQIIEELGEIIVAAGTFWEDFHDLAGAFSIEHHDHSARMQGEHPAHLEPYSVLRSSSGFENIEAIRNFLLQYYTEEWVYAELSQEWAPFVEYNGVLYMLGGVAGPGSNARPDWSTSSHVLVEQRDNVVVIDTTLYHGSWHRLDSGGDAYPFEVTHRFVFVDGRIDFGPGGWDVLRY